MSVIRKPKLELTWIGKENRPRLEPRILLEDPERSYHAKHRVSGKDIFDNRLTFGVSLWAVLGHLFFRQENALQLIPVLYTFLPTHAPCLSSARMMHIKGAFFYSPWTVSRAGVSP